MIEFVRKEMIGNATLLREGGESVQTQYEIQHANHG